MINLGANASCYVLSHGDMCRLVSQKAAWFFVPSHGDERGIVPSHGDI